ncbi:MAG TPA: TPM domain-containing protein [Thermoanaerobaculia bacterium]
MFTTLLAFLLTIPIPAKPARYVTDNAGVLTADRAEKLDQKLKAFEQQTSDQVLVYVDKKVPDGTTLEEMGAQAIHQWGVGQAKKDNGVILFLFTDERKMRIEVGYGLEGSLTDAKSKLITSTIMKPRLQSGDYNGAVEHGVEAILNTIGGESYKGSGHTVAEASADATSHRAVIPFFFLAAIVLFLIIRSMRFRRRGVYAGSGYVGSDTSSSSDWSSSDSSSSDSSSSSDFDSGGGDGGGGGASDSF